MTTQTVKHLQAQCGTFAIAKHLKSQGYPLYMAIHLLAKKG
ncbi:hypothetical protein [Methylovorus sp. MM2]|nr:hypothetical protein [Methylovorus sp. MM2]